MECTWTSIVGHHGPPQARVETEWFPRLKCLLKREARSEKATTAAIKLHNRTTHVKSRKEAGRSRHLSVLDLLQQFQYQLLLLVSLRQSRDAGLFQDGILGQVRDRR